MKSTLTRALGALVAVALLAAPATAGVSGAGGGSQTKSENRTEVHTNRVTSTHTTYLSPIIRDLGDRVVRTVTSSSTRYVTQYASDWRTTYWRQNGSGQGHTRNLGTSVTSDTTTYSFLRNGEREVADTFIKDTYTKTGETFDNRQSTQTVTDSPDLIIIGDPAGGNGYVAQGTRNIHTEIVDYIWDNFHKETTRQKTLERWKEYQANRTIQYTTTQQVYATTPIVLNMDGSGKIGASQGHWMAHEKKMYGPYAVFDFFGSGEPVLMEWIGQGDGLLCRPRANGTVDGTCLFGSSNGFDNGFEELAVLDTNNDRKLTGDELSGLAVWQDRNGNAIVGKSELASVQSLGITEISLDHDNLVGSFVRDGKQMKMWDWQPTVQQLQRVNNF